MSDDRRADEPLVVEEPASRSAASSGQSVPRKEDKRLVQGQGVFFDDVKRARHGLRPLRPLAVRARERSSSIDVSTALGARRRLRDADRRGGRGPDRPVLPDLAAARRARQGLRARGREGALRRRAGRGRRRRDARARARRGRARRGRVRAAAGARRRARARSRRTRRSCTRRRAANVSWSGRLRLGRLRRGASPRPTTSSRSSELHFDRFYSTPLECAGALVEYNRGTGQWTIHSNNQIPGFAAIRMGAGAADGARQAPLRHAGHRRRLRQQDHLAPAARRALPARAQAEPADAVDGVAHRPAPGEVARERALVPGHRGARSRRDGTMLGFRTKALDDCGAFPRYEPLGCIIWAQVTPGCYRWRNIRVDFTQVCTNKSPVLAEPRLLAHAAPLADRADHRHRRARARPRPGRGPEAQLRPGRGDAVRDAERLRLRLRRLRALPRHRARADRLRLDRGAPRATPRRAASCSASGSARRSTPARTTSASRAAQPGAPVLGQQRGRDGQARHLRRGRRHARHDAAGAGARDDGLAGGRRHHRRARPTTCTSAPGTTPTGTRTPASPARTRASSRSRASARSRAPPSCSPARSSARARSSSACGAESDRARGRLRPDQGRTRRRRCRSWPRRDREREQRRSCPRTST